MILRPHRSAVFATDIMPGALAASAVTSARNAADLLLVRADLLSSFRPNSVDLCCFHCPYVPTTALQLEEAQSEDAGVLDWGCGVACGPSGHAVLDRCLAMVRQALAPTGVLYLLFYGSDEVGVRVAERSGMHTEPVCAEPASTTEKLRVLRCTFDSPVSRSECQAQPASVGQLVQEWAVLGCGDVD